METLLLETLQNILNSYNIQTIEEIQKNRIIRFLKNEEVLTRLLLKYNENIPYTRIYKFVKENKKFKEIINNYENQIIINYLNNFKHHIQEEQYELVELEEIFRQSIINNLTQLGINKISIEKCLEENLDLWFDECIEHSFNSLYHYDEESEEKYLHKLYFTKMKKYVYYQRHKYIVELYGTVTPEMHMTDDEAKPLQIALLNMNDNKLILKK